MDDMANIQNCPGFEPFGEDVKAARKKRRLSRQKAAEMAGISTVRLINIEKNHITPALPVIIQLIQILNPPAAKYFNQLTAGDENDPRQRIRRKAMICPEEQLPVIRGAVDGLSKANRGCFAAMQSGPYFFVPFYGNACLWRTVWVFQFAHMIAKIAFPTPFLLFLCCFQFVTA
jgi:transcriptional regulator with XRE-family HTH domain